MISGRIATSPYRLMRHFSINRHNQTAEVTTFSLIIPVIEIYEGAVNLFTCVSVPRYPVTAMDEAVLTIHIQGIPVSFEIPVSFILGHKSVTDVYNTQTHWGSGLYPSSEILNITKHDDSENGSVREKGGSHLLRWVS
jgi:hypothetical protein